MSVTPLKWTLRLIPKDVNLGKNPSYKTPFHFVPVLRGQSNNVFSHVPLLQIKVSAKHLFVRAFPLLTRFSASYMEFGTS